MKSDKKHVPLSEQMESVKRMLEAENSPYKTSLAMLNEEASEAKKEISNILKSIPRDKSSPYAFTSEMILEEIGNKSD